MLQNVSRHLQKPLNMKKLIPVILIILFSEATFSQESNCANFKIGKFLYKSEGLPDILVTRTETEQIESVQDSNHEFQETVFWISDCSYKLTYTKAPIQNLIGKSLIVELFDAKNNLANGKASFEGTILEFTVEKIE